MRFERTLWLVAATLLLASPALAFDVEFGVSWDGVSLQEILDAEYGIGAIDVATEYEGYHPADAVIPYWEDVMLGGVLVREIAGYSPHNILGWYEEDLSTEPIIDGFGDGVVFSGNHQPGDIASIQFPGGMTRFGFYLNPNGTMDATNAPEPEKFYTNRFLNDVGPNGTADFHGPTDGDPQCLVYNITHLRDGVPTFVLAWEDLDYGSQISPSWSSTTTDNDYNDLVVEVSASSPVKTVASSFGQVKALYRK